MESITLREFSYRSLRWLEVPNGLLVELGIAGRISSASRMQNYSTFLDGEVDYGTFTDALEMRDVEYQTFGNELSDLTFIESLGAYDASRLPVLQLGSTHTIQTGLNGIFSGNVRNESGRVNMNVPLCGTNEVSYHCEPKRTVNDRRATLLEFILELNSTMIESRCSWGDLRVDGSLFDHYETEFVPSDGIGRDEADFILNQAAKTNGASLASSLERAYIRFNDELILSGVGQPKRSRLHAV